MKTAQLVTYVASSILLVACQTSQPPPPLRLQVYFYPWDLATGPSLETRVRIHTPGVVDAIDPTQRDAVIDGIAFQSLPDGLAVPMTATIIAASQQELDATYETNGGLSDGWYSMTLRYRESDMIDPSAPTTTGEDGWLTAESRFHVGSLPILRADAEPDPNDHSRFIVRIATSEPTILASGLSLDALVSISSGGNALSCTLVDPTSVAEQLANPSWISFSCLGVDPSDELAVTLGAGVTSAEGIPLHDMDGSSEPVRIAWIPGSSGSVAPLDPSRNLLEIRSAR